MSEIVTTSWRLTFVDGIHIDMNQLKKGEVK